MFQKRLIKHIKKLLKKKIKQQYGHEQNRNLSEPEIQMLFNHIKNGGGGGGGGRKRPLLIFLLQFLETWEFAVKTV